MVDWFVKSHERTTTAKNMGILKYHPTSLKLRKRYASVEDLIKPNQASIPSECQVNMLKVPVLALIIEASAV
jgi:hypothetical protein